MAKITMTHPHTLPKETAKEKVNELFLKFKDRFGINLKWDGDTVKLSGSGFDGVAKVFDDKVDINVNLGLMVSAFKGQIESGLQEQLNKRLSA